MKIWLDDVLINLADARISPLDRGLTVGDGVFETLRVYDGEPFAFTRHFDRLHRSASALGLSVPTADVIRSAAHDVIVANDLRSARLRVTVTGGEGPPGSSRAGAVARVSVIAVPFTPGPATTTVVVAPWTRNERSATAGLKTISYAANVRALAYAESHNAGEAIFANTHDNLCEATGSNVFVVTATGLATPPEAAGCLLGVTRGLVVELAQELGIPCAERDITMDEFRTAAGVFLSSTTREVQPVTAIDGSLVSTSPEASSIGEQLRAAYQSLRARTMDP